MIQVIKIRLSRFQGHDGEVGWSLTKEPKLKGNTRLKNLMMEQLSRSMRRRERLAMYLKLNSSKLDTSGTR